MSSTNKENISINIQTEINPGKTEVTTEIHPSKGSFGMESDLSKLSQPQNLQSENLENLQQEFKQPLQTSSLEKDLEKMHIRTEHEKNIPFSDLSGIETYNESMQIYFRDAYNLSRIFSLTMALQLNIFEIIMHCSTSNNDYISVKDIRTKILTQNSLSNISERHLSDLLNELETQGFLESEGSYNMQNYRLTDLTKKYFLKSSQNSIARMYLNINRYMKSFEENFLNNFSLMGKPLNHAEDNFLDENETNMVMDYFYKTSESSFNRMLDLVDLSRFKRVIDLRGSYGLFCSVMKKRFPLVDIISWDNPSLENYAVNRLSSLNMINDVILKSGSILTDKIPEVDCAIAPHLFMHFNNENCMIAMRNVYNSLTPNGQLIILENLIDPNMKDCKAITMSFMMGVQNCEGNARTFDEFNAMLLLCGFKSVDRVNLGKGMSDMLIAVR